jgi:TolB protein
MLKIFLLFLSAFACCDEIVVTLETAQLLHPIYLSKPRIEGSSLSRDYAESLINTLAFDMKCGGYTLLSRAKGEGELKSMESPFPISYWSKLGTQYVIVPEIHKETLSIKIFDVKASSAKELIPIPLSGSLKEDRLLMHKISDLIHKNLWNVKGIAQKRILFAMQKEEGTDWISEIWECGMDGEHLKQVTFENSYSICPIFIPSKNQRDYTFLYVCYKQGMPKIYRGEKGDKIGAPIIPLRGNQLLPAVSRNVDKIAFISDAAGRADLFLQMFDPERGVLHKPVQIFSYPNSVQASPTFSPDGTKLAFVSDKEGTPRVYIVDVLSVLRDRKSPELQCITTMNRENTSPCWSPDGKKIVYSAKTNGIRQIWFFDVEKKEEIQLTTGQANKENPCFAEDSLHIVYNSTSPSFDIFLLDLNQQEPVQITRGAGKKHYPCWEP